MTADHDTLIEAAGRSVAAEAREAQEREAQERREAEARERFDNFWMFGTDGEKWWEKVTTGASVRLRHASERK